MAALILYVPGGGMVLNAIADAVQNVIDYANVGIQFLFGELGERKPGSVTIAFHVLPVIVFFAALMAMLYYLGIMQWSSRSWADGSTSCCRPAARNRCPAVANIFVGHTEAPLVVRPYLSGMTKSELFAVMTAGMATIAGAVMAGYAAMGVELKYLITASFMGAPGGLLMAKIIMPETDYHDPKLGRRPVQRLRASRSTSSRRSATAYAMD